LQKILLQQTRLEGLQGLATSVSWLPDGKLVAARSPFDTKLHIWSPASQICEVVHRRGGGGVTLASLSPNKRSLFTATPASVFRVWETKGWTCDRWSVGSGRVAAAAWAPDSLQLVFATTEEPVLYCLSFQVNFQKDWSRICSGTQVDAGSPSPSEKPPHYCC